MINDSYFVRQSELIPQNTLNKPITLIGAGGIGSWTALALLKMGCQDVKVIDFDIVEQQNVGSQLYTSDDIGKPKVEALADHLLKLTEGVIQLSQEAITDTSEIEGDIIISAVDTMQSRMDIFNKVAHSNRVFIDGRMAANEIQIYTIPLNNQERLSYYLSTLFSDEEATPISCTRRAVMYNTLVIAGFITNIVAHILNTQEIPQELEIDLLNFTLY